VAVTVVGAVTAVSVQVGVVDAQPVHAESCAPAPGVAVKVMLPPGETDALQSVGQLIASTTDPPSAAAIVPAPCTAPVITTSAAPKVADTDRAAVIDTEQVVAVLEAHPLQLVTFASGPGTAVTTTVLPFAAAPVQPGYAGFPLWQSIGGSVGAWSQPKYGGVNVGVNAGYVRAVSVYVATPKFAVTVLAADMTTLQRGIGTPGPTGVIEPHPDQLTNAALLTDTGCRITVEPVVACATQLAEAFVAQAIAGVVGADAGRSSGPGPGGVTSTAAASSTRPTAPDPDILE